ncbi:hypothetical protein EYF80_052025 [Liparis tanakae]|uniref:Uncharacterized protein n=1 Tax=Liparis tanakae TaxID=230148 RepID=A0A4Z2FBP2_9TELE|nr:hypothetical protein EYF80_052025 [Liparis tanakae]
MRKNLLLSSTVLKPAYCLMVHGLLEYMGNTPGNSSGRPSESARVYTGFILSPSGVRQIRFSGFFPFSCFLARLAHSGCSSLGSRRGADVWIIGERLAEQTEALARRRAAIAAARDLCAVSMLQGRLYQTHMDRPKGGNDRQIRGGEYCDVVSRRVSVRPMTLHNMPGEPIAGEEVNFDP